MRNVIGSIVPLLLLSLIVALTAAGCGEDKAPGQGAANTAPPKTSTTPAIQVKPELFVREAPGQSMDVSAAMASAKEGETLIVRGRIGGSHSPFVDGRASFSIGDMSLMPCNQRPGDACETPWDFCCEERRGKLASVQITGPDQQPLKTSLQGQHDLAPLRTVVVEGIVGPRADPHTLVLTAQRIYVEPTQN